MGVLDAMTQHFDDLIIGQGLAGSAVAWTLHWAGRRIAIVDRNEAVTSSKVAAGLVTPFTGQRLVRSEAFETYWPVAIEFYRRVETELGTDLFQIHDALRLFEDSETRAGFLSRTSEEDRQHVELWEGSIQSNGPTQCGIVMSPAGRLRVADYLNATKSYFAERNQYFEASIESDQLERTTSGWLIEHLDLNATNVVFCTGAARTKWFHEIPNNPARGDILSVRIPDYTETRTVHRSIWIAANDDGSQTVGATYDWDRLDNKPRVDGRIDVLEKLERIVPEQVEILSHRAAVRPIMRDYRPVVGPHPQQPNLYILNGLGSKGTLQAPTIAQRLANLIESGTPIEKEFAYERMINQPPRKPLTALAQELVANAIHHGDTAVDATVGNGFDTCFLAEQVGLSGRVIGFDIQQAAIDATRKRLDANGYDHVELRLQSHTAIDELEPESVAAVMFNLGYLPRGDHSITTTADSSVAAVKAAVRAIRPAGIVSILCYRGHAGGTEEQEAVDACLRHTSQDVDLQTYESNSGKTTAPILLIATKRES